MRKLLVLFLVLACLSPLSRAQRTASNPLGGSLTVQDAGTCSTTGSFFWQTLASNAGTTTLNLSGTFTATVTVRESNNGGTTWTTAATLTSAGTTTYSTAGFTDFCVDATSFSSGPVIVSINTGSGSGGSGSSITLQTNGTNNGSQSTLNLTGGSNVTVTDNGSGTDTIALTGLSPAPNTIAAVAGQKLDSYNQGTGNFTQSRYGIAAPIFSTTDTLTDTVNTQQLFATNMSIPANTLITNVGYKFMVGLEWTTAVTVPNYTFEILLCPTQGSATGCKDIYKSTTTPPIASAGTFSSAMEFGFVGETAAGATATVMMAPAGGVGANSPVGRNVVAMSQGNIPTNATLFVQFAITFGTAGTGTNSLSIRTLIPEPGPIL